MEIATVWVGVRMMSLPTSSKRHFSQSHLLSQWLPVIALLHDSHWTRWIQTTKKYFCLLKYFLVSVDIHPRSQTLWNIYALAFVLHFCLRCVRLCWPHCQLLWVHIKVSVYLAPLGPFLTYDELRPQFTLRIFDFRIPKYWQGKD